MLGRLIDQLFPTHVRCPTEARHVQPLVKNSPALQAYNHKSPWGNTLPLFTQGHLNLVNLETAATTHSVPWPDKAFNYRMHPSNVAALHAAGVDYATLANNHTLDFCEEGLLETVRTLKRAGIAFAGAGESAEEAVRPAVLNLPPRKGTEVRGGDGAEEGESEYFKVHVYAASDHPRVWKDVPNFHLIDYSLATKQRLRRILCDKNNNNPPPDLKVVSIHWGPNYEWQPVSAITTLAHFLVDECGVDIVHGHSSHHIQGVEGYRGKLIIYGCGDFVDDYALTPGYRNDLSALWRVVVRQKSEEECNEVGSEEGKRLSLERLEVFPTRIKEFQAQRVEQTEGDFEWIREKLTELSRGRGTSVEPNIGNDGQFIVPLH